jgi:asparagine synthase (glutamine-hydrolysing)
MCGLAGAFAVATSQPDSDAMYAMSERMSRRGPDDAGSWSDGRCSLEFRRLSILDLNPTGHQPMTSVDGRYHLVFNGELYNFQELRGELEAQGRTFRSTGDAEVCLNALAAWGPRALARFNGMFALGFYDAIEQRLLIARDHAGIKPLHYAHTSAGFLFASQYNQLLAHPWMQTRTTDPNALGLYLRFGFVPSPYGLHARTGQLAAGSWLAIDRAGVTTSGRYFTLPSRARPSLSGAAAGDAFEDAFSRAVRRHLVADVPVGVLLSGGIDSPLVAAEARRHTRGDLLAFTIGLDDPEHDETADARDYAAALGLEHVVERVTGGHALGLLDDVARACTEPTADYSIFPTLIVSRLARRQVKVVLSGDGGDELYWGYPSRFTSAIAQARYFAWPAPARLAAVGMRRVLGYGTATREVLAFDTIGRLYQRKHTLMNEDDLARVFPELPPLPASFDAFSCGASDPDEVAQWVRWNEFQVHLERVLAKVDRASMYHSLEVRVPLLDREVIEVAWRTDWRACLDLERRIGKRVLRDALARRLGKQTTAKRGFTVPMYEWLRGPLRPALTELVLERRELLGTPIDRRALADVDRKLLAGDRSKAWGLWMMLALALWSRTHDEAAT